MLSVATNADAAETVLMKLRRVGFIRLFLKFNVISKNKK
jgi:hypothetical protein